MSSSAPVLVRRPSLAAHVSIARFDHWVKNVFVLPGIAIAMSIGSPADWAAFAVRVFLGLLSVGLIASSNYTINEVLDAPFDRFHPQKRFRPVPSGQVSIRWAYVQWLALMAAGMFLAFRISLPFAGTMAALWIMGILYNVPPVRTKDLPYLDVISESVNNPLRMLAGWYLTRTSAPPPASLLVSYWMTGCYFMGIKRYSEFRDLGHAALSAYRKSFALYNERRLLVSIMFYAAFAMLTFGAFVVRYRLELILAFPAVSLVMAAYLSLSFKTGSAAQNPEKLYREPGLMAAVIFCALISILLLFIDIPALYHFFTPLNSGIPVRS